MTEIRIRRDHAFGLARARQVAWDWARESQGSHAMTTQLTPGDARDVVRFNRAGIDGTLVIAADHYELTATLGFLLAAFKPMIEAEISRNLDALMAGATPGTPGTPPGAT